MSELRVGIGLRQPHYAELLNTKPPLAFVEVHSENFFADGGAALAVLHQARAQYPVSLHGVGLALGSAAGLDPWHLERLARLVDRIEPIEVPRVEPGSRAECQAHAMQADRVELAGLVQYRQGRTAVGEEVLGVNFDEAERRRRAEQLGVVGLAQADPHTKLTHFFIAALASSAVLPPTLAQVPLAT